jgi:hypothetical protein
LLSRVVRAYNELGRTAKKSDTSRADLYARFRGFSF